MKVIAILGSPRKKGDCFRTIEMLEKSFNKFSKTEIEYVYLNEMGLGFCKSCFLCYSKGEEYCPNNNVTSILLEKMLSSDIVIFASPVYEQHVTALMKNFYDNFSFMFHRPRFFGKKAIIVSSTGASGLKETLEYMKMNAIGWGFEIAGIIGVCGPSLNKNNAYKEEVQNKINHLAEQIYSNNKTVSPSFYQLSLFRAMQCKALKSAEKKNVEYGFWLERGWFEKDYYTDQKINFVKRMYSKLISYIMKKSMNGKIAVVK